MRIAIAICICLLATQVAGVELLVKAKPYWQNGEKIPEGTTQDTISYLRQMWHQAHRGEIIVIKPDGWNWGSMETPPRFIIVKIPGVSVAQAQKYIQGLVDTTLFDSTLMVQADTVDIKERRWYFLKKVVDSALVLWATDSSFVLLTPAQATNVVKEYDIAVIKQKIRDRLRQ